MELRQLRHFVILAEEMHFGRASNRLSMTQPALSTSLMRLEEELEVRLFERDSKGMSMTLIGRAMLTRAQEIVSLASRMERFGRAMAQGRAGLLEVGFTGTLLFRGLDRILISFGEEYPDIELSVREYPSQAQLDMVRTGRLDAAFVNNPTPPAGLESLPIFVERIVACIPDSHPLASKRQLDIEDLRDEVFVMFSRESSPAYFDNIVAICATGGFQPRVRVAASQVLTVVALVASRLGVSLVPESVKRAGVTGAVYIPIRGVQRQPSAFMVWNSQRDVPGLPALIETVRRLRKVSPIA